MILNGKAKEDFLNWVGLTEDMYLCSHSEREIEYMQIEWLDSVGILIEIGTCPNGFTDDDILIYYHDWKIYAKYNCCESEEEFNTRQEATKQAIIKANYIYNERD